MPTPARRLALALLLAAGCGVPKETYLAKEAEAQKYRKAFEDESEKTADFTRKMGDLSARLALLEEETRTLSERVRASEENLAAKQADLRAAQARAAELQALVDQLARSKAQLEAARHELEAKSAEYERMAGSLKEEIEAGRIELSELRGRMTVKMADKVLFASGSASVNREGRESLKKVAAALRGLQGRLIRVEGHTDDVPLGEGGPFATNWELSTARALAVVRFLQEQGVDPTLLGAAGYGEYQPVASNGTLEGRAQNRRIEIVLAAAEGTRPAGAPAAGPPPGRAPSRSPASAPRRRAKIAP